MEATLLVNRAFGETRIALLEDGQVSEIYVERDHERGYLGNIYKGRITRVLPGMQAAFVDVGLDRAAFLYVDDVHSPARASEEHLLDEPETADNGGHEDEESGKKRHAAIAEVVSEGQEIVCQVSKDPLGTKGARVTSYITLPGRYVVYMPTVDHVGISKRITDEAERRRLKEIVESLRRPGEGGFIVRTEGVGLDEAKLREDMDFVRSVWSEVEERTKAATAPSLIMPDLDLVLRATRDLFTREVERMIVDDGREVKRIRDFLSKFAPSLADRVELFEGTTPLFDLYGVELAIERALQRKVALKSGASIVIDQAEALTAIDINTGRFVGKQDLEATILRTNLEAIQEIVAQLRLRNIGGIIVIDFIDMESSAHRQQVFEAFLAEMKRDRAKNHVLPISDLGVVEMTRKRVRESLGRMLTEACPYCNGDGRIRSRETVCLDVFRELMRQKAKTAHVPGLIVSANPEVAAILSEDQSGALAALERAVGASVVVEARADFHREQFRVRVRSGRGP